MTERCIKCNEPLYIRSGDDIRVFHLQSSEFRKTKKGQKCKNPTWRERFKDRINDPNDYYSQKDFDEEFSHHTSNDQ